MLSRLQVRDFQSLADVDIELAGLTVVVGPSSSGKSALVRALRVLLANGRGASFVRQGRKTAALTACVEDGFEVTLTRGTSSGEYVVQWAPEEGTRYTKLGGTVPEQVSAILGCLPDGVDLRVAGQFDRPFLLDESGAGVARVLGALTRVSVILGAAREANRRRLAAASTLRVREADLEACVQQAQGYVGLGAALAAQDEAEQALERAERASQRLAALRAALEAQETAEAVLGRLEAAHVAGESELAAVLAAQEVLEGAYARLRGYQALCRELAGLAGATTLAAGYEAQEAARVESAEAELHALLVAAGECPVCGSAIEREAST